MEFLVIWSLLFISPNGFVRLSRLNVLEHCRRVRNHETLIPMGILSSVITNCRVLLDDSQILHRRGVGWPI